MEFLKFLLGINMNQYEPGSTVEMVCIGIAIGAIALLCVLLVILCLANKKGAYNIESLTFAGICIALSFGLSYARMFRMPLGGSVTYASILPICLYAYIFGFRKGVLAGLIYSMLQILQDPVILNFIQMLLDYILGFTSVCLAGMIPHFLKKLSGKNKVCDAIVRFDLPIAMLGVGLARFIFSTLSGVIYFGTGFGASMAYNSVLLVDTAIAIVPAILIQLSPHFMSLVRNIQAKNRQKQQILAEEKEEKEENPA